MKTTTKRTGKIILLSIIAAMVLAVLYFAVSLIFGGSERLLGSVSGMGNTNSIAHDKGVDLGQEESFMEKRVFSKKSLASPTVVSANESMPRPDSISDGDITESIIDRKIIKNGSISLVVEDIESSRKAIEEKVKEVNGFVSSSNFSKYEDSFGPQYANRYKSAHYSLRIPQDKFDNAIRGFKKMAIKVVNENISSRDVTSQYQDTELQIKIKRAEEEQYRKILSNTKEVKDVLNVTRELNRVVGEIERQEGMLRNLKSQVSMSTLNLNLQAKNDVQVGGVIWTPLSDIKDAFNGLMMNMKNFLSGLIYFVIRTLPVLLLKLAIIYLIYYFLKKVFGRSFRKAFSRLKEFVNKIIKD